MAAPISVIVPTLNAGPVLPGCLAALVEGLDAGLIKELIVSDGGSTDDTIAVADAWGAEIVRGTASRGRQLRRGCARARGTWLLVLHADTQLMSGWTIAVRAHLQQEQAGYFQLRFDRGGRLVAAWANLRARIFGLPYGDQGLLISRSLYNRVGGYPEMPLMEDVALARALKGHFLSIDATACTSAARYREQGWIRRGARNLWTLMRYLAGGDPHKLAENYHK